MDFNIDILRTADIGTALEAVSKNGLLIQHLPEELKNDAMVVNAAFEQNREALSYAGPQGVIATIEMQEANEDRPFAYELINPKLWSDKEFVIHLVSENADLLAFASDALKEDQGLALAAIKHQARAFSYVGDALKSNLDFIFSALDQNPYCIKYLDDALLLDRNFILSAVRANPDVALYIPDQYLTDKAIMSIAMTSRDQGVYRKPGSSLKNDPEFACIMVKHHPGSLYSVSDDLKMNRNFILSIVKENGFLLKDINANFKSDPEIVGTAINNAIGAFQYADGALKGNSEFVKNIAIPKSAYALKYVSEELKNNEGVVLAAVHKDPNAFQYAGEAVRIKLGSNKMLFMTLIAKDYKAIDYANLELKEAFKFDEATVREAMIINPWMLVSADAVIQDKLMNDSELMNTVIKQHPWAAGLGKLIKEKRNK